MRPLRRRGVAQARQVQRADEGPQEDRGSGGPRDLMARVQPARPRRAKTRPFPLFQQMTIVGVGLIGGSLGMICKQQGLVKTIVGAGRRGKKRKMAGYAEALVRYALCILTPTSQTDPEALAKVRRLWEACGARIREMDPMLHDRVLGAVSHVPHVLAFAIVNTIATFQERYMPGLDLQAFAGGGYKDTTRIAASSPEMWRDICLWTRDNLLHQIELYEARLNHIKAILKAGDGEGLVREFTLAKQRREKIT